MTDWIKLLVEDRDIRIRMYATNEDYLNNEITIEGIEFINPSSIEDKVRIYNLTHEDSHILVEYLTKEEIKEKYGEEF